MELNYTMKRNKKLIIILMCYLSLTNIFMIIIDKNSVESKFNYTENNSIESESIENEEQVIKTTSIMEDVPLIDQFPELPTGCEVTCVTMLLNYYGINVDKMHIAEILPKERLPYLEEDRIIGENPNEYFIGDPSEENSFGVFHKPILKLLSRYGEVENITGKDFSEVIDKVNKGMPVIAWITRELVEVEYINNWYIGDELFWWPKNEHTVVIVGVNDGKVIVNDPYGGEQKEYDGSNFEKTWVKMGKQAVLLKYPRSRGELLN